MPPNATALWIPLCVALVLSSVMLSTASAEAKNATLDSTTVKMLSNILESLDTFRQERLRDLEKLRFNDSKAYTPSNHSSAVSDSIKALRENIMGHHPIKKTFGYKVTVYTSPIEEGGKDGKPILVTQYVGGDMRPDSPGPPSHDGDLEQSANDPQSTRIHSSGSHPVPVNLKVGDEKSGGLDHSRKTEHHVELEKGHKIGHKETSKKEKGHDRETHLDKHGVHHKDTDKESHRVDEHSHDKGGASQQGIRERTEIEYYEREHFLDTEYDKAKGGHEKTSGVNEHESHKDHDSHDLKRLHTNSDSQSHASSQGQADQLRPSHYSPPYGGHAVVVKGAEDIRKDQKSASHLHSEDSSGHREHNSEKNHTEHQDDKGYHDKDKGRRKEGYRERGYKITAEREYFLNDAHHDTGHGFHKSGQKLRENEGEAHGSKAGERDRGFTKEQKEQESHDAAYDKKERHYEDGEKHAEGYSEAKAEHLPGVTYVDSPAPLDPHVVVLQEQAYIPSGTNPKVVYPSTYKTSDYEDQYEDEDEITPEGYQGHATYKKRHPSATATKLRDVIRDAGLRNAYEEVRAPPKSYGPPQQQQQQQPQTQQQQHPQVPKETVRFPDTTDERINSQYTSHLKPLPSGAQILNHNQQAPAVRPYLGKPAAQDGRVVLYPPPPHDPTAYDTVYRPRTNIESKQQASPDVKYQHPPPRGNQPPRPGYDLQAHSQVANRNVYDRTQAQQVTNQAPRNIYDRPFTHQLTQLSPRNIYDRPPPHQATNQAPRNIYDRPPPHQVTNQAPRNVYDRPLVAQQVKDVTSRSRHNHPPPATATAVTNDASGPRYVQQSPATATQEQTARNPYSPIVLLSRGPPVDKALDVWYTRPQQFVRLSVGTITALGIATCGRNLHMFADPRRQGI